MKKLMLFAMLSASSMAFPKTHEQAIGDADKLEQSAATYAVCAEAFNLLGDWSKEDGGPLHLPDDILIPPDYANTIAMRYFVGSVFMYNMVRLTRADFQVQVDNKPPRYTQENLKAQEGRSVVMTAVNKFEADMNERTKQDPQRASTYFQKIVGECARMDDESIRTFYKGLPTK
jgi:hypothetical protein